MLRAGALLITLGDACQSPDRGVPVRAAEGNGYRWYRSATPAKAPDRGVPVRAAEGNGYRYTWEVTVTGDLELRGVRRALAIPLRVTLTDGSLLAEGTVRLRQRDYGIDPVSVGGVVKVKNELAVSLRIVARPAP